MGDFLHPPYNVTQPRQLNRWLDVNSQNGPLERTRKFLTMPAFGAVDINWLGYSDIVATYNYVASNNFSLVNTTPEGLNFLLCIAYMNEDGSIVRYKLNEDVGEVFYLANVTLYNGEIIKTNFRFEVWSAGNVEPVMLLPIIFTTTLRGNVDYRYGVDTECGAISTLCTTERNIPSVIPVQPPQTNIISWWKWDTGITQVAGNISSWLDRINASNLAQAVGANKPTVNGFNGMGIQIQHDQYLFMGATTGASIEEFWIAIQWPVGGTAPESTHIIYLSQTFIGGDFYIQQQLDQGLKIVARGITTFIPALSASPAIINIQLTGANKGIYIYDMYSGVLVYSVAVAYAAGCIFTNVLVGDSGADTAAGENVGDIIYYSSILSVANRQSMLLYLMGQEGGETPIALPLTFYPCAQLVTNNT